jgi:hypothetical protein
LLSANSLLDLTVLCLCRCLVCDRSLMDRSISPPYTAPAAAGSGRSCSPLPLFDQFRPSTAAAGYSSCTSSSTAGPGLGPHGPGLNAAQLRRMAEARMQGGSVSASLTREGDAAEAGAGLCELGEGIAAAAGSGAAGASCYCMPGSSPGPNRSARQHQQQRPQTTGSVMAGQLHGRAAAAAAAASAVGGGGRPATTSSSTRPGTKSGQQQAGGGSNGRTTPVFV